MSRICISDPWQHRAICECGKPVPPDRNKWCSKSCPKLRAWRKEQNRLIMARNFKKDPEKYRQRANSWREQNREKAKAVNRKSWRKRLSKVRVVRREYVARNQQKFTNYMSKWRAQNRSKIREYGRKSYRKNKLTHFQNSQRRRARKAQAPGSHTLDQWMARVFFYGWLCGYCGIRLTTETLTKDHVKALIRGGSDWSANLVPACLPCNVKKGTQKWLPHARLGTF